MIDILETLRQNAANAMQDATGNASICQIHKDGQVTGGMKYQEGRLVVMGEVIRRIKKGETPADVLDSLATRWTAQLAQYQSVERPTMAWVAYSQGGVDAIAEIRRVVDES